MTQVNKSFRATYGLDAAGQKVINVAKADTSILTDGVNVEFLIQENTVQNYDPSRGYPKDFLIKQNDRLWIAQQDIPAPSGTFSEGYWRPARVDPKWKPINSGKYQLQVGDYITVDTEIGTPVELTLPSNAQEGDNIVVRDIGGYPGFVDVIIKAGIQSIFDKSQRLAETRMTIPYSEWTFIYVNKLWNLYNGSEADLTKTISSGNNQIQAGQVLLRDYSKQEPIILNFPKNAINGDLIQLVGVTDQPQPYYNLVLKTWDSNSSVLTQGQTSATILRELTGYFSYNASTATWVFLDTNKLSRYSLVNSDTLLFPNQNVSVYGSNNTTTSTVKLTLPTGVEDGATISVALNRVRLKQVVNIVSTGSDKIFTDKNLIQFPKRSSYPTNSAAWNSVTSLSFDGTSDYLPVLTFAYSSKDSGWYVVSNIPALERVDPTSDTSRSRLGVIALATQGTANLDKESMSVIGKEVAITPETLANRTSLETRRGIARIATQDEVNKTSDDTLYQDDIIVTPKKLDQKQSTESMRGLAEIATQSEANGSTDDARIITAKKLDARRATPTMAGVAPVVTFGAIGPSGANATRDTPGTLIYNYNDYSNIVTPKTLREFISTPLTLGSVYLATSAEVIAATDLDSTKPLVVTPATLHTKTATETRIGFTEIATQSETNVGTDDFRFITPKKLNSRISSETLTGIARLSTQDEFNSGASGIISEPAKIKVFFSDSSRTSVTSTSGLVQSGNLWTTTNFDIKQPTTSQRGTTTLATQAEVNAGTDNIKIVTSLTLANKKSTETAEGIIRIATSDESISGSLSNVAVSPKNLINAIQIEKSWEAQINTRGTVKMTENGLTFVGNNTNGSTQNLDLYEKTGYAISPYELNKTLSNFLPLKAKAVDSDKLDGIDSSQFIRRDIDQNVAGVLTLSKQLNGTSISMSGEIISSIGTFKTDANHYLYLGKTGDDVATLGAYNGKFSILNTKTNNIDLSVVSGNMNLSGSMTSNSISTGIVNSSSLVINDKVFGSSNSSQVILGTSSTQSVISSSDANSVLASDSTGSYNIITKKNYINELKDDFVRKIGDTVSGRLNVRAPIVAQISESSVLPSNNPSSENFGSWTINISSASVYNQLPGYVVPVYDTNKDTGETLPWVGSYNEIKGPGTMSQFGSSESNGIGTYRIWAPRPSSKIDNQNANSFYINHWDPVRNTWAGWGRIFTNNAPPTASDIGAMANNGSVFDSLKVRDWIQIGNLKIYADPTTKSVKFDWID